MAYYDMSKFCNVNTVSSRRQRKQPGTLNVEAVSFFTAL